MPLLLLAQDGVSAALKMAEVYPRLIDAAMTFAICYSVMRLMARDCRADKKEQNDRHAAVIDQLRASLETTAKLADTANTLAEEIRYERSHRNN